MKHVYINRSSETTNILLHGTGGDEHSLIELSDLINPNANILAFRGNIQEKGLNRFFKRFSLGTYDLNSYHQETKILNEQILILSKQYNINLNKSFLIGFSNGANIAVGILQDFPQTIKNFVLLSPDYIDPANRFPKLRKDTNVFISSSFDDPYCSIETINQLLSDINNQKVKPTIYFGTGHQVDAKVIQETKSWYNQILNQY